MERVREGYVEREEWARGELSYRGQFSCAGLAARSRNLPLPTLPCPVIESSPRAQTEALREVGELLREGLDQQERISGIEERIQQLEHPRRWWRFWSRSQGGE